MAVERRKTRGRPKKERALSKPGLTDNKRANRNLFLFMELPIFVLIMFYVTTKSLSAGHGIVIQTIWLMMVYVFWYFFASYFFSPDLDIRGNRPGKHIFPFIPLFRFMKVISDEMTFLRPITMPLMRILSPVHQILNLFWKFYWEPFARSLTHRGAAHWPVFGTALRFFYIHLTLFIVLKIELMLVRYLPVPTGWSNFMTRGENLSGLAGYFKSLQFFFASLVSSPGLIVAMTAILVADLKHIAIDWMDTIRKGSSFVPPESVAPRGFFLKLLMMFRSLFTARIN